VSDQDTVSGVFVVALSKEIQELAQGGGEEQPDAFEGLDGVEVTDFDDGTFVGKQYKFSGLPLEELILADEASSLTIQRDGDSLIVSGGLSFTDESEDTEDSDDLGLGQALFDSADLRVSIKFPGRIVETNGQVDESSNTITWELSYGKDNELSANVYSPQGVPSWVLWSVGSLFGVTALTVVAILLVRSRSRSRRRSTAEDAEKSVSEVVSARQTDAEKEGFPRSDRPIFTYRVRSSPFSSEVFELRVYDDELSYGFISRATASVSDLVTIQIAKIDDVARIMDSDGLGVRLNHSGQVEIIPANAKKAEALVSLLRALSLKKIYEAQRTDENSQTPSQAKPSYPVAGLFIADELRQLSDLRKDGVISEDEFLTLKKKRIERE
jgi:hypothetical protein